MAKRESISDMLKSIDEEDKASTKTNSSRMSISDMLKSIDEEDKISNIRERKLSTLEEDFDSAPTLKLKKPSTQDIKFGEFTSQTESYSPEYELSATNKPAEQRTAGEIIQSLARGTNRVRNAIQKGILQTDVASDQAMLAERRGKEIPEWTKYAGGEADTKGKKVLDAVGEIATLALPYGKVSKVSNKIMSKAPKLFDKLVKKFPNKAKYIEDAIRGGLTEVQISTALEARDELGGHDDKTLKERALNVGIATAGGAVGDPLIRGVGELGKKIFKSIKSGKLEKIDIKPELKLVNPTATKKEYTFSKVSNKPLEKAIGKYNEAIETIQDHFQHYELTPQEMKRIKPELGIDLNKIVDDLARAEKTPSVKELADRKRMAKVAGVEETPKLKFGDFPKRETPIKQALTETTTPKVPKLEKPPLDGKLKPSRFATETAPKADITRPETKAILKDLDTTYEPITNEDTLAKARNLVENNIDEAESRLRNEDISADSFALTQELVRKAQNEGRYEYAANMIKDLSERGSKAGQAVQSLSMWGRLTPVGMLKHAQNVRSSAVKNGAKIPSKIPKELVEKITKKMEEINKLPDGREQRVKIAQVLDEIQSQVPVTWAQRISTFQTMAMLLNPKTAIRNIVGNAGFAATEMISDTIAVILDIPISKFTGTRTKLRPEIVPQLKGMKKGWQLGWEDAIKGIDTSSSKTKFDLPTQRTFRKGILGALEKAMNVELRATDRAFFNGAYEKSIKEQMKIAKVKEPNMDMIEIATLDGLYKTFQDDNRISKVFSGLKKSLNYFGIGSGDKTFGLGDLVLKFPRTPANLLSRGFAYSPAGYVKTLFMLAKETKSSGYLRQKKFVEGMSRATVGTAGLVGIGITLQKLGILTGKRDDDLDLALTKESTGLSDYQINASALKRYIFSGFDDKQAKMKKDDTFLKYDWFQPNSISIALGADFAKNDGNYKSLLTQAALATSVASETLIEQPLLTGISNLFKYGKVSEGVMGLLVGMPSTFIPTFVNQVNQVFDDQARSTYDPNILTKGKNKIKRKIPGLAQTLEPRIDVLGEEKKYFQPKNPLGRILNTFINPAIISKFEPNEATKIVFDLAEKGYTIQAPRYLKKYITVDGKRIDLTAKEYTLLQKTVGKIVKEEYTKIVKNELFNRMNDEEKAKALQKILTNAGKTARDKIIEERK